MTGFAQIASGVGGLCPPEPIAGARDPFRVPHFTEGLVAHYRHARFGGRTQRAEEVANQGPG